MAPSLAIRLIQIGPLDFRLRSISCLPPESHLAILPICYRTSLTVAFVGLRRGDQAFVEPPDEILVCSICGRVAEGANECPCGHLFCGAHIRQWLNTGNLSCPTCRAPTRPDTLKAGDAIHLAYRRQIGELKIRCPHADQGCPELLPPSRYRAHLKSCGFAPAFCRWKGCRFAAPAAAGADWLTTRALARHLQECKFRLVACPYHGCNKLVRLVEFDQHCRQCADISMVCPIKGCGAAVTRGTLELHLEDPLAMAQHLRLLMEQVGLQHTAVAQLLAQAAPVIALSHPFGVWLLHTPLASHRQHTFTLLLSWTFFFPRTYDSFVYRLWSLNVLVWSIRCWCIRMHLCKHHSRHEWRGIAHRWQFRPQC